MIEQPILQRVINTKRLELRPLRISDAGLLTLHTSDERVARNTASIPHPMPPGGTESFIEKSMKSDKNFDVWAMDGSVVGLPEVLGLITLDRMDRQHSEVSYWVAPAFWNTGLASEAVEAMVAVNPHEACTFFAAVFQDNPASARVLTNAGFDYLGDAESYSVAREAKVSTWTYMRKVE